jgi:hypothetical protein
LPCEAACSALSCSYLIHRRPSRSRGEARQIRCVDGNAKRPARDTARIAMLAIVWTMNNKPSPDRRMESAVRRSVLMQASDVPIDNVYSMIGLFEVDLKTYHEGVSCQDAFNDLARKTAAQQRNMGWLTVGSLNGGLLRSDKDSHLIPPFPAASPASYRLTTPKGKRAFRRADSRNTQLHPQIRHRIPYCGGLGSTREVEG